MRHRKAGMAAGSRRAGAMGRSGVGTATTCRRDCTRSIIARNAIEESGTPVPTRPGNGSRPTQAGRLSRRRETSLRKIVPLALLLELAKSFRGPIRYHGLPRFRRLIKNQYKRAAYLSTDSHGGHWSMGRRNRAFTGASDLHAIRCFQTHFPSKGVPGLRPVMSVYIPT